MCEQITFLTGRRLPLFAEGLLWKLPTFCPALLCLSLHLIYGVTRKSCQILDLKRPGTIYAQHWCQNYGILTPKLWSYIAVYITWNGVSSQYARVILIGKIWFLQLLHGFKMFHFIHWFQNSFCFRSTTIPSAVRKFFGLQWENGQKSFFCQ